MNLKQKSGISLIILAITIAVMIILSGAIISSTRVSNENALLSKFVNDIAQLQESARAMYIMENKLPIVDENVKITKAQLLNMVTETNRKSFEAELLENGESTNTYYYQLDLQKAGAGDVEYGTGKDDPDDIYVISANSLKVYYLMGVEYEDDIYFSINAKLANIVDLPENFVDDSKININSSAPVTKEENNNNNFKSTALQITNKQKLLEFSTISGSVTGSYKSVKYCYKVENGITDDIDAQYLENYGKMLMVDEEGKFSIKIPNTVSVITVGVIDINGDVKIQDINL